MSLYDMFICLLVIFLKIILIKKFNNSWVILKNTVLKLKFLRLSGNYIVVRLYYMYRKFNFIDFM